MMTDQRDKSRVEELAQYLYLSFKIWQFDNELPAPSWKSFRGDLKEDFLKLAERLLLEDR